MTQNSLKIAVTGGIGSGKSTVSEIIRGKGYPVFSCDQIYSELLTSKDFLKKLENEFDGVISSDGTLDRKRLSEIVFNNDEALKKLNAITHPEIMAAAKKKMERHEVSFLEVPLLFENGFENLYDSVIVVLRDREERIKSVMARDGTSREKVTLRLKSQFDYDNSDFTKYYVIHNCGNLSNLEQNTLNILKKIENDKKA